MKREQLSQTFKKYFNFANPKLRCEINSDEITVYSESFDIASSWNLSFFSAADAWSGSIAQERTEKIKRARIYQGITLKELCGNKVSISKMSCIENGKIKADKDILEIIDEVLNTIHELYKIEIKSESISKYINEKGKNYIQHI